MTRLFLMALTVAALTAGLAGAAEPDTFAAWTVHRFDEDGQRACYMAAAPQRGKKDSSPNQSFAMVTHRPAQNSRDVFSYLPGYDYKKDAQITLTIDGRSTLLYGAGKAAWTENEAADARLVGALRRGTFMTIEGNSAENLKTRQKFSLKGFSAAYLKMNRDCKIDQ